MNIDPKYVIEQIEERIASIINAAKPIVQLEFNITEEEFYNKLAINESNNGEKLEYIFIVNENDYIVIVEALFMTNGSAPTFLIKPGEFFKKYLDEDTQN